MPEELETNETPFDPSNFEDVDMSWSHSSDTQTAWHTHLGSLTVLDRMTGFGHGVRDTETGFRCPEGDFWLASGNIDVRLSGAKTLGEAIQWVKDFANNCVPKAR